MSFLFLFLSPWAMGDDFHLKLIHNGSQHIADLNWDESKETQEPLIQVKPGSAVYLGTSPYFVTLHGKYLRKDSALLFGLKSVPLMEDGSFELEVEIGGDQIEISMTAVDVTGTVESEVDHLRFSEWANFKKSLTEGTFKKFTFQAGVSLSGITYIQSDSGSGTTTDFSEMGVNVQGEIRYQWLEKLAFTGQVGVTALPIAIGLSGNTIRILSLDAQAIYPLWLIHDPWKLEVLGSYSYRTTFQSSSAYGYTNVQGLTIYPHLEKAFSGKKSAWISLRFMPILAGGLTFLNLSSYEASLQGGYKGIQLGSHRFELFANLALLALAYSGGSSGSIQANSYGLGANYLF